MKDAIANARNVIEEKYADFVEWTGLCEEEGAPSDGFVTRHGDFSVDYDTSESSTYEEYYGEDAPPGEDATETAAEL